MERSKGSQLKGWIEKPERFALASRSFVDCAFIEAVSRKIANTVPNHESPMVRCGDALAAHSAWR